MAEFTYDDDLDDEEPELSSLAASLLRDLASTAESHFGM